MRNDTSSSLRSKVQEATLPAPVPSPSEAFDALQMSMDRFCLVAGIAALREMVAEFAA